MNVPPNPLLSSTLHRLLVFSNALQAVPAWGMALAFLFNGLVVALVWLPHGVEVSLVMGFSQIFLNGLNWGLLRELPRRKRSFGPDKPSALALGALQAVVLIVVGFVPSVDAGTLMGIGLLLAGAVSLLAFYATWVEPFRLGVTEEQYRVEGWSGTPLRLLHIGDIHIERVTARERHLNKLIESLKPDVIVFSGDFVNLSYTDDPQSKTDIREIVGAWRAPLGVFAVPGTPIVEPMERVLSFVEGLTVDLLANRWVTVNAAGGEVHILGLVTTHDLKMDRAALRAMMRGVPVGGLKLLLTHSPDLAPEAAEAGFDLYLCGHTHGGQIRLPLIGAIFSASQLGNRFVMGRYQVGGMTLYTTRGVGLEGLGAPRARFLCPPEIVLWKIGF